MASSINKVILIGNVGKDPEIRFASDQVKMANFSIATSETWKDKTTGERKERTEWHRITIMNDRLIDVVEKYIHKGAKVYVEGQLQTRTWTDKAGQSHSVTEIVIGRFKGELTLLSDYKKDSSDITYSSKAKSSSSKTNYDDLDDHIPF